jgi:type IV secretory pathway VirB2 component (pilin)
VKVTIGTSSTTITLSEDSIILLDFVKKLFGKGFAAVRMDEPLQKILSSLLGLFLFMALVLFVIIITQRVKEMRAKNP